MENLIKAAKHQYRHYKGDKEERMTCFLKNINRLKSKPKWYRPRNVAAVLIATMILGTFTSYTLASRKTSFDKQAELLPPDAQKAQELMRTAINHYQTVYVKYTSFGSLYERPINGEAKIDLKSFKGWEHADGIAVFDYIQADKYTRIYYNSKKNEYQKEYIGVNPNTSHIPDQILQISAWVDGIIKPGIDLPIMSDILFPQQLAENLLLSNPKSVKDLGHKTINGREAIGVQIIPSTTQMEKIGVVTLYIDASTGVILERDYIKNGVVQDGIKVDSIQFDQKLNETDLTIPIKPSAKNEETNKPSEYLATCPDNDIPNALRDQWNEAKNHQEKTTILKYDNVWYIYPKKGFMVDHIEVIGNKGKVILGKASVDKVRIPYKAVNYKIDSLVLDN
jgi:hypothetical protein